MVYLQTVLFISPSSLCFGSKTRIGGLACTPSHAAVTSVGLQTRIGRRESAMIPICKSMGREAWLSSLVVQQRIAQVMPGGSPSFSMCWQGSFYARFPVDRKTSKLDDANAASNRLLQTLCSELGYLARLVWFARLEGPSLCITQPTTLKRILLPSQQ
ncbi:uncharacterized protein CTRU02_214179 [Colletotrichum truncatum]|uniref:Uncharacterized protein n=1 Tax=Colletotrichum truncatum TaxID=5467 RepID=A0ACC3YHU5_COLTU|nr:uncharacterized protein CTRU02_11260 [Colletotrichum truncatum]KAF6786002.1 hypothetical protein CTRU02_11260 [Colletotrichum truncatum]